MAKPIITLNGLKIVIMLGMLVIILTGVRFAADIIVPFILALFIAVILNPLVQRMVRLRIPRVLAISLLISIIIVAMVLLVAYLGTSLNELARTLPTYRSSLATPLLQIEPWLQRAGIEVSVEELLKYIDPNAAMTIVTSLLAQLSNAMTSIFLLFLTVVFMLLEVPQLPAKLQHIMVRPVEGMGAIQRALDSVSRYLVLKTAISLVTGLVVWGMLAALDVRFAFVWGLLAFALNYIPNIGTFVCYGLLSGQTFRQQRPLPRVAWFHIRNYLDALSAEAWQAEFRRIWPKLRASQCSDVTLYPLSEWQRAVGNYREAGRTGKPMLSMDN